MKAELTRVMARCMQSKSRPRLGVTDVIVWRRDSGEWVAVYVLGICILSAVAMAAAETRELEMECANENRHP